MLNGETAAIEDVFADAAYRRCVSQDFREEPCDGVDRPRRSYRRHGHILARQGSPFNERDVTAVQTLASSISDAIKRLGA
jgi:hypothetical protein